MHEVFATVRLWQLDRIQNLPDHAYVNGVRIFGKVRWEKLWKKLKGVKDHREQLFEVSYATLHTCGFVDDPTEKNRTLSNLEAATIAYVDARLTYMHNWPLYVQDEHNPNSMCGIEQSFDVTLTYSDARKIRFIGTLDGLVRKKAEGNILVMDENKTSVRMSNAWRASFDMSHQVTGYCAACEPVFGFPVTHSRVTGVLIPPQLKDDDVRTVEPLVREPYCIADWSLWVRHSVEMFEEYKDDYEKAPTYTHSCSRYFVPCSLLPFCTDSPRGRIMQFEEMVPAEPSPSERAVEQMG